MMTTACVEFDGLFLHELLEDARSATTSAQRNQQRMLTERARRLCAGCPMLQQCRYDAIVKHDVAGFVGGTTEAQRSEIRRLLKVKVSAENLDAFAGAFAPNRQVSQDEVVRLRKANPYETLDQLASRLGCSLSTVKRHLRRARLNTSQSSDEQLLPTPDQVSYVTASVLASRSNSRAA